MIRIPSIATMILTAATVAAVAAPAGAQTSEARIQELVRQASERLSSGQAQAAQPTAPAATADPRPVVPLSLDDAVKAALDHNLNIAVQRLNPEINDISIASLESVYRPALSSVLSTQS